MKRFYLTTPPAVLLLTLLFLLIGKQGFSQETQNSEIKLTDRTVESKLSYATWRIDYYICTGIAYAKSLGMTVDDFAAFVASKHSITSPSDTSISAVIKSFNMVMTTYPKGKVELLTQSNTSAKMKWNRPYASYYKNGPVLGVSLDEFESYLYGHVAIMTKRIGIDFEYDIKSDTVFATLSRYR
ncbi:MAG: hypothetical protein R6W81_08535 [Bacteroidales bacterium]